MAAQAALREKIEKISPVIWELPVDAQPGMRVPARIYATEPLMGAMDDGVFAQLANVAALPGIVKYALCMPDGHWGYGFPIGGVMASEASREGVISPGGIGFDINCGMRLMRTDLTLKEVQPRLERLIDRLFARVPSGVGGTGFVPLKEQAFRQVVEQGANWCVAQGYGWDEDLRRTEEQGCFAGADAAQVSPKAIERGRSQIGTLGSGNHYLEIQVVSSRDIFDAKLASRFGLERDNQVVVMFHCGSRGFGHQVATDYLRHFLGVMEKKYSIPIVDRELACAPFDSPEGQAYFAAMKCAVNMSFANRQVILHRVRQVFAEVFEQTPEQLGLHMVFDIAHNIAKLEQHEVDGQRRPLLVHRKGATRALAPGAAELPEEYRQAGQPVIVGGSMQTGSYLLVGAPGGTDTFFTTAHGSGRTMSRRQAAKRWDGRALQREMAQQGIYVRTASLQGLAEEAGGAYKDIDAVIEVLRQAGISRPVARFRPIGSVKG